MIAAMWSLLKQIGGFKVVEETLQVTTDARNRTLAPPPLAPPPLAPPPLAPPLAPPSALAEWSFELPSGPTLWDIIIRDASYKIRVSNDLMAISLPEHDKIVTFLSWKPELAEKVSLCHQTVGSFSSTLPLNDYSTLPCYLCISQPFLGDNASDERRLCPFLWQG